MKEKFYHLIPCLVFDALTFYLLPCIIRDTGSAMFVLLLLMPLLIFLGAVAHGIFRGFFWPLPLACMILFMPTVWIFYNASAWIYTPVFGVIALLGSGLGAIFHKRK